MCVLLSLLFKSPLAPIDYIQYEICQDCCQEVNQEVNSDSASTHSDIPAVSYVAAIQYFTQPRGLEERLCGNEDKDEATDL